MKIKKIIFQPILLSDKVSSILIILHKSLATGPPRTYGNTKERQLEKKPKLLVYMDTKSYWKAADPFANDVELKEAVVASLGEKNSQYKQYDP